MPTRAASDSRKGLPNPARYNSSGPPARDLERRAGETGDPRFHPRDHRPRTSCRRRSASRPSTRTAHCGSSIRCRRRSSTASTACRAGRKQSGRAAEPRSGSVYPIGWPIRHAGWVGKRPGSKWWFDACPGPIRPLTNAGGSGRRKSVVSAWQRHSAVRRSRRKNRGRRMGQSRAPKGWRRAVTLQQVSCPWHALPAIVPASGPTTS